MSEEVLHPAHMEEWDDPELVALLRAARRDPRPAFAARLRRDLLTQLAAQPAAPAVRFPWLALPRLATAFAVVMLVFVGLATAVAASPDLRAGLARASRGLVQRVAVVLGNEAQPAAPVATRAPESRERPAPLSHPERESSQIAEARPETAPSTGSPAQAAPPLHVEAEPLDLATRREMLPPRAVGRQPLLQPPVADTQAPTTTLQVGAPVYTTTQGVWVTDVTTHTLRAEDNVDAPADLQTFFRTYPTAPFTLSGPDGRYRIEFYSVDTAGNQEEPRRVEEYLDTTPPQSELTVGTPQYTDSTGRTWVTSQAQHALVAADPDAPDGSPGSGVDATFYRVYPSGGTPPRYKPYTTPFALTGADGAYTVEFFSRDHLENEEQPQQASLFLDNTPPVASAGGPYSGDEGASIAFDASASTDAGSGIDTIEWDLNNDGTFGDATGPTASRAFGDDGTYTVAVRVTDHLGHSATASAQVTVRNVAPTVAQVGHDPAQPWPGQTVTVQASFTDPGWLDTHTATIDWGDGTTSAGSVSETNDAPQASGTVSGQHHYAVPGTYTITVTVTDDDGGTASSSTQVRVELSPQMPGIADTDQMQTFLTWTRTLPGTGGSAKWQWQTGQGTPAIWWIYEADNWLYFFQVTPNDVPNYDPNQPEDINRNFLAIAVPKASFQRWFWCGVALQDANGNFSGYGCDPQYGPPPDGAGELHPWVQNRIAESRSHVLTVLGRIFQ